MLKKLVGFLLLLVMIALVGCSKEPTSEERFSDYVALWNQQKFAKMYDYLSSDAKKQISKEQFTSRYQKIYKDLQITDLKIGFKKPKKEQDHYTFTASMNSIAGRIKFSQQAKMQEEKQDDNKNWYVDWNTEFIFPKLKEGDTIGVSMTAPTRGEILDRNGTGLAVNGQVYEVGVVAGKLDAPVLAQLASLLKMTPEQITKAVGASWVQTGQFVPLAKVSMNDQERIKQLVALEPVQTRKVNARVYPYGQVAAQLVGYVGAITADELEKLKDKGYTSHDVIGKRGLEQVLDEQLRGTSGVKIVINKKAEGAADVVLAEKPVVDGKDVKLTIDAELQKLVYGELNGESGTAAAMNPVTGETLALVSSPSFDPNQAVLGFSADEWKALQDNPGNPLATRFKLDYAPGSVMKPLTAAVGLEGGAIVPSEAVPVIGKQWQKDKSWGNYFVTRVHAGTDPVNLEKALVYSDNIYFAQAALRIGKDKFVDGLKKFGFEEDLGYPFPLEKSVTGTMGSEIALADSGYGQGQVEMSIVHLLAAYTPFVNGDGNVRKPILLADEQQGQVGKQAAVSAENAGVIAADLRKVVSDPGGTAHAADMAGIPLAGKTGTAEIKQKQGVIGTENGWFIAYNTGSPRMLVAMMVENVQKRGGSQVPVKKVKNVFEKWK
ncbi:penicillin-binding transpeptidase domain-containing protein [Neobacillus cucumis]|uniref:penicillin-binding transpeptidase domain-containing protein n=1 Tax=Neobacillus cucumis TaxID=1740721 RepID=UPI0028535E2E|nr:penicillin-binding transpeptidase domain-containing protein [Neobacillus cucumis]MDR4949993.1 penicillin-binding transpeptidase domain-containing protein [Neobacillus cucumis]